MKRTLDEIRKDFEGLENSSKPKSAYISIMHELIRDYDPSEELLNKPEDVLYRQLRASSPFNNNEE